MSELLKKLDTTTLGMGGKKIDPPSKESKLEKESLEASVLDPSSDAKYLDRATESKIEEEVFQASTLDLENKTPQTYRDTAPEGRTF